MFELLAGNAGIALGALQAGDTGLALLAVEPYLLTADPTPGGVNWAVRPSPPRSHHLAHGTLGIVYALAAVGAATGRDDLAGLARAGAADVVARNEAGPAGFVVPHSDPPHRPDLIDRCGTAGVLALACDRRVEQGGSLDFADVLAGDLTARATSDAAGVRWSNYEHRATPSALAPRTGWAMGSAGIIRELLRFSRAGTGRDPAYAVPWPDHPV
jgi:hypothetical protein